MPLQVKIGVALRNKPHAKDPDHTKKSKGVNQPTVAPVTFGPNRYTIRVPSFATKLSLGQGDKVDAIRFNKRPQVGTESGIVGQTDTHAHFHTFGTELPEAKTLVRLGIPPTSVPSTGPTYAPNADTGIGTLLPDAYKTWNGYSMVTQGSSYQESRNNHLVVSAEGEVRIVGKTFVNIGTSGDVILAADTTKTPIMLVQNQAAPTDPVGMGVNDLYFRVQNLARLATRSLNILNDVVLLEEAVRNNVLVEMKPMTGENLWEPPDFLDTALAVWSVTEVILKIGAVLESLLLPSEPGGRVGIFASENVAVGAEKMTTIVGGEGASVNGGVVASLNAGAAASVNGTISASMGGITTTISGTWSSTIESMFRPVTVKSPAGVHLTSTVADVCVTGTTSVQLNAVVGSAYVVGGLHTFTGSGAAMGFGMSTTPADLFLGLHSTPVAFAEAMPIPTCGTIMSEAGITTIVVPSIWSVLPEGLEGVAPTVNIESPEVKIGGGFVYLG